MSTAGFQVNLWRFFQSDFDEGRALFSKLFTLLFKRNPSFADTPTPPLLLFPWFYMQCTRPIPLTFPEYVLLYFALVFWFSSILGNLLKLKIHLSLTCLGIFLLVLLPGIKLKSFQIVLKWESKSNSLMESIHSGTLWWYVHMLPYFYNF